MYNIKLTANKQRIKGDGLVGLRFYISGLGQHDYISTGISWALKYFDEKEGTIKRGNADVKTFNSTNQIILELQNKICKILDNQVVFSISDLKEELKGKQIQQDFITYALKKAHLRLKQKEIQFSTYKSQITSLNTLKEYSKTLPFSKISIEFLNGYKTNLIELGYERNTIWKNLKDFRTYLNIARLEKILFEYPFGKGFKMPKTEARFEFLHESEFQKLKEHYLSQEITEAEKPVLRAFLFSCYTSLRLGDILELRAKNIRGDVIEFEPKKTRESKTKKFLKLRIPLHHFAKSLIQIHSKDEKLFTDLPSEQKINERLKKIAKSLNIEKNISFHYSRHTFATRFLAAGGAIEILQEIMGHEKIETTMIYVHIEPSRKKKQISLLT